MRFFIITVIITIFLPFNSYSQVDSLKSKFNISTITNIFKKKTKNSLQNQLTDTSFMKSSYDSSTISETSSGQSKKIQSKKDTLVKKTDSHSNIDSLIQNEFIKKIQIPTDSSSAPINIFIVGSSNVDVNVSSGGIITVNKIPPGLNQQLLNMSNDQNKKRGFLADMDSSKLTSLITLILASIPIIINATK